VQSARVLSRRRIGHVRAAVGILRRPVVPGVAWRVLRGVAGEVAASPAIFGFWVCKFRAML